MEKWIWKIRIVVLWIYLAVGMSAAMLLWLLGDGVIEEVMEGKMEGLEISDGVLLFFAMFWIIPLTMAFLTLVLEDRLGRWVNLVMGAFFAVFYSVDIGEHLTAGGANAGHIFVGIVGIVVAALIAWHGWKWPEEGTSETEAGEVNPPGPSTEQGTD